MIGLTPAQLDSFRNAMEAKGVVPPEHLIPDGKLRRFASNGEGDASWYVLHDDGMPAGAFGDWRSGVNETWSARSATTMTATEREAHRRRIAELRRVRDEEERLRHADAAQRARELWDAAQPATGEHPYLQNKKVNPHGLRVHGDGRLIVPLLDTDSALHSVEFISANGEKLFLAGGKTKGLFFLIGKVGDVLVIAEGYATGASIHEAVGYPVAVAFSAGNLLLVAQALRAKYPQVTILLAGDNDQRGGGQEKANEAAQVVGGVAVIPDAVGLDWNDVAAKQGIDAVKQAFCDADLLFSRGPSGPSGPAATPERGKPLDRTKKASGPGGPAAVQFPAVPGYRIAVTGVFEVPTDPDKPESRLTLAPCGVLAHCRDGARQNWGAFLRWTDRDGHLHEAAFPVGRFHEPGGALLVDLANLGLPIMPGMEKKLLRYLASGNPRTRYRAAIQTGWQEDTHVFVLPTLSIGGTNDQERVVYQPDRYSPTSQSVRVKGTLVDWQAEVAGASTGNPVLVFWLSASLAAPLLHVLGLEGGGFHLYGLTSQGKTTAEQIAASVWGDGTDPAEGRLSSFVKKWNLTKNATEGLAEAHNDLPLCLDEVGEADAREFGRMIYQLAGGQGKGRMRADATLKPSKVWRTMLLSTGEVPSADIVESEGRRLKGGQAVRLVDVPATDPITGVGILTDCHGAASSAVFADTLKRACSEHFGHAGPAFIQALIDEGLGSVREELRAALHETAQALTKPEASPEIQRIAKRLALVAVAGEKAAMLGLVPWEQGEAVRAAKAIRDRYLFARGGMGGDTDRALESIKNFLLAHITSRFRELSNETDRVVNLAGYRDSARELFYLTPNGFKEACGGHDVRETARLMASKALLRMPDAGHFTERVSVPGMGRTRLYAVSADIFDGERVEAGPLDRLDRSNV